MAHGPITHASEPPPLAPRELRLRIDPLLLLAALGLVACSVVALNGATADDVPGEPNYYVNRQLIFAGIGVVLMYLCSRLDYSRLRELRYPLYGFMIFAILVVFVVGSGPEGANLWIATPFINIQTSELGKVLLVLSLSAFLVDALRRVGGGGSRTTLRVVLLGLLPALLVTAQPDLGSALVYLAGIAALLFVAGTPWKHFVALGAAVVASIALVLGLLPAMGVEVLKPYQVDRLTSFLNPEAVAGDEAYQQQQSVIAIGSGEKTGRGIEGATQTSLDFLPEHHTDFIFAVVGETYGFAGAALVLSLYALLLWRGLHILTQAKNLFGALIAGGITMMLLFQIFVNVGMTVGVMPITGIPAPLLSYGGSSMLVTFLALGLLQSIAAQAKEATAMKTRMAA
jgi:rod shape determining protein RodA